MGKKYLLICLAKLVFFSLPVYGVEWSKSELVLLKRQWIGSLPALPPDPSNKYADNLSAAKLGHLLFFDRRLSVNGKVSCATCHVPEKRFTDGLARSKGIGETARSAPGLIGVAHSPWFFWDGRSDSLWSQALGPLEAKVEHGGNRLMYAHVIYRDDAYRQAYETLFGQLPDLDDRKRFPPSGSPAGDKEEQSAWNTMSLADQQVINRIFVNIAKAIAAYERKLMPGASRFDHYVEALLDERSTSQGILSADEIAGLKLFTGKAMCVTCHQGPLFTNHAFHNVAAPNESTHKPKFMLGALYLFKDKPKADVGRYDGVRKVQASEFNCLGEYSDAEENDCAELRFASTSYRNTLGAFKVPSLRNVALTAPYMHAGQLETLDQVLKHYNEPPMAPSGHSELVPLSLDNQQLAQIKAFLHTLDSPPGGDPGWLQDPFR